jgi:hypothetical protein
VRTVSGLVGAGAVLLCVAAGALGNPVAEGMDHLMWASSCDTVVVTATATTTTTCDVACDISVYLRGQEWTNVPTSAAGTWSRHLALVAAVPRGTDTSEAGLQKLLKPVAQWNGHTVECEARARWIGWYPPEGAVCVRLRVSWDEVFQTQARAWYRAVGDTFANRDSSYFNSRERYVRSLYDGFRGHLTVQHRQPLIVSSDATRFVHLPALVRVMPDSVPPYGAPVYTLVLRSTRCRARILPDPATATVIASAAGEVTVRPTNWSPMVAEVKPVGLLECLQGYLPRF